MFLNLVGEIGEFSSKVAKGIRKGFVMINENHMQHPIWKIEEAEKQNEELRKEAGDIMWQLFGLIDILGWDAEEIAQMNLDKLQKRKKDGVIDGNGDNR